MERICSHWWVEGHWGRMEYGLGCMLYNSCFFQNEFISCWEGTSTWVSSSQMSPWLVWLNPLPLAKEEGELWEEESWKSSKILPHCHSSATPEEHSRLQQCPWWPSFLSPLQETQVPSEKEDSTDFQSGKWDIGAAGSTLGKGLQHNTPCCLLPSLCLWLGGSIPPGIFPCSPRHVSAWVGSLDTHSEPSHPAPYPFHIPKLLESQLCSKQQEPGIAPACSSLSSNPSHISSSKALILFSELLLQTWACPDTVVLGDPVREGLGRREQMWSAP